MISLPQNGLSLRKGYCYGFFSAFRIGRVHYVIALFFRAVDSGRIALALLSGEQNPTRIVHRKIEDAPEFSAIAMLSYF